MARPGLLPNTNIVASDEVEVKPAAQVWNGPNPTDPAEQVAFFRHEGFLVLPQVIGKVELDELDRELVRLAENYATLPSIREGFSLEPNQDGKRKAPTFRKIGGVSDLSQPFERLLKHERILNVLHALMGDTIELWRDVVMMKPARVGREKPWHQDSSYWPWRPMSLISAMTALDDAGADNGCLQVIPRTHEVEVHHYGKELHFDMTDDLQARTMYVPLRAGDTLLFHSLLMHASEPNYSDRDRRVIINSYKSPELKHIKGEGFERECPLVSKR